MALFSLLFCNSTYADITVEYSKTDAKISSKEIHYYSPTAIRIDMFSPDRVSTTIISNDLATSCNKEKKQPLGSCSIMAMKDLKSVVNKVMDGNGSGLAKFKEYKVVKTGKTGSFPTGKCHYFQRNVVTVSDIMGIKNQTTIVDHFCVDQSNEQNNMVFKKFSNWFLSNMGVTKTNPMWPRIHNEEQQALGLILYKETSMKMPLPSFWGGGKNKTHESKSILKAVHIDQKQLSKSTFEVPTNLYKVPKK